MICCAGRTASPAGLDRLVAGLLQRLTIALALVQGDALVRLGASASHAPLILPLQGAGTDKGNAGRITERWFARHPSRPPGGPPLVKIASLVRRRPRGCPVRLLQHMGELMREQPFSFARLRGILPSTERHVVSKGVGQGIHCAGRSSRFLVGVYPHAAEISAEAHLHEATRGCVHGRARANVPDKAFRRGHDRIGSAFALALHRPFLLLALRARRACVAAGAIALEAPRLRQRGPGRLGRTRLR